VFGLVLHWFPATGYVDFGIDPLGHLRFLVLPAATLALEIIAITMRMTRSSVLREYPRSPGAAGWRRRRPTGMTRSPARIPQA
jgi:hypothetical protein